MPTSCDKSHSTFVTQQKWHGAKPLRSQPSLSPDILRKPKVHYRAHKRTRHWSLSWVRWIQSIPPYPTSLRYILVLSSHLHLGLPSGLFPSGFPVKTPYVFLFSPCLLLHPPWLDHYSYIWGRVRFMKLIIMQFSPASYYISLGSEYSPQHPVLRYPQSMTYLSVMLVQL
jgi:hypothetical protein